MSILISTHNYTDNSRDYVVMQTFHWQLRARFSFGLWLLRGNILRSSLGPVRPLLPECDRWLKSARLVLVSQSNIFIFHLKIQNMLHKCALCFENRENSHPEHSYLILFWFGLSTSGCGESWAVVMLVVPLGCAS